MERELYRTSRLTVDYSDCSSEERGNEEGGLHSDS